MATRKNSEEHYQDAKRYLAQFKLRTAEEERDYAAQWMGSSYDWKAAHDEALKQLEVSNKEALELRTRLMAVQAELAKKDGSFKPPPLGQA